MFNRTGQKKYGFLFLFYIFFCLWLRLVFFFHLFFSGRFDSSFFTTSFTSPFTTSFTTRLFLHLLLRLLFLRLLDFSSESCDDDGSSVSVAGVSRRRCGRRLRPLHLATPSTVTEAFRFALMAMALSEAPRRTSYCRRRCRRRRCHGGSLHSKYLAGLRLILQLLLQLVFFFIFFYNFFYNSSSFTTSFTTRLLFFIFFLSRIRLLLRSITSSFQTMGFWI